MEPSIKKLLEYLPNLICTFLPDGRLTYVNRTYCAYFGKGPEELIGNNWLHSLPARKRAAAHAKYKALRPETPLVNYRHQLTGMDGESHKLIWTLVAVFDDRGKAVEYHASGRDIPAPLQSEQALRESEERLRAIFQACADPMVVYDVQGHPLYINPAFSRVFGWTLSELRGRHIDYVPEDQRAASEATIRQLYETGLPATLETRRLTKGGKILDIRISASLIRGSRGEPEGMVVNLTDISERRQLEIHLQQSQKLEAIGTLAGGIAHDFNNILSAIIGYTELARGLTEQKSNLDLYLDKIGQAANRAADLVRQILTFSRQAEHELVPLHPKTVVLEVLKLLRALLPSSIRITSQIDSEAFIMADPTQLHQIVMNLCTNAAQALPGEQGAIDITLKDFTAGSIDASLHPDLSPGAYVQLSVSDDGQGMAPHIRGRIFDPFFTTKPLGKGTGMGLSLVHGIVKSYHGVITVKSAPGQGSTFTIFIPVTTPSAEVPPREAQSFVPHGSEHILLVDDEESLAEIGRRMLERLGYRVTALTSSLEALQRFSAQPQDFDLVIADQTMPHLTGDRLAIRLRQLRPDLPIFICTGFSERIFSPDFSTLGVDRVLLKPLSMKALGLAIREVLDQERAQGPQKT